MWIYVNQGIQKTIFAVGYDVLVVGMVTYLMLQEDHKLRLCQSMRIYGFTFFLVKERMKGRNCLVPHLLSITKESIMWVDEITKQVSSSVTMAIVARQVLVCKCWTHDHWQQCVVGQHIQIVSLWTLAIIQKLIILYKPVREGPFHSWLLDTLISSLRFVWLLYYCINSCLYRNKRWSRGWRECN